MFLMAYPARMHEKFKDRIPQPLFAAINLNLGEALQMNISQLYTHLMFTCETLY